MEVRKNWYFFVEEDLSYKGILKGLKVYNINLGIVGFDITLELSFTHPMFAYKIVHKDTCDPAVFDNPFNTHDSYCDYRGCMDTMRIVARKLWLGKRFRNELNTLKEVYHAK